MKTELKKSKEFKPFKIELTFESKKDLDDYVEVLGEGKGVTYSLYDILS